MNHLSHRHAVPLISLLALPVLLPSCAPRPQSAAYGENVSYYFDSEFACPEHVPAWRQLGDTGMTSRKAAHGTPGDASDAFEKALATLGQRSRDAITR